MKFDCIIMNPPYSKDLHLKILDKAISMLKDENSVCVNLSPISWMQDPLAKYKKKSDYKRFENSISKHIEKIIFIKATEANSLFNIRNFTDLGIYVCNLAGGYDYTNYTKFSCKVKQKVLDNVIIPTYLGKIKSLKNIRTPEGQPDFSRYYVILPMGYGNSYKLISSSKDVARRNKDESRGAGTGLGTANFDTDEEAENFRLSLGTKFIKFCVSLVKLNIRNPYCAIPYMSDYTEPWTDERFYKHFNITPEEQKIIEETIKKYS